MTHHSRIGRTPLAGVYVTLTDSARSFPRHWHGTYGIGVVDRGAQRSGSGRGVVEAVAGQCITHNPAEVHDGTPIGDQGRRWRMFHIEPDAMARLFGLTGESALEWRAPVLHDVALRAALLRAFEATRSQAATGPVHDPATAGLLEETLLLAVGRCLAVGQARQPALPSEGGTDVVMSRLADDVPHAPTLDELAALAGTSRFSLVRRFSRSHGLPPMAWLMQLRLQRARQRIAAGWSLADTALSCGFSDQSHLTRLFTRQFGYTPGCWRRAVGVSARGRAITF
jgi:AraC-like DNA-binding protein